MNIAICMLLDLPGYEPPADAVKRNCCKCDCSVWATPVLINAIDNGSDLWCAKCAMKANANGEISDDDVAAFTLSTSSDWKEQQRQMFLTGVGQHDREIAWTEDNLGAIAEAGLALGQDAVIARRAINVLIQEMLIRRINSLKEGEAVFDNCTSDEMKSVIRFMLGEDDG